MPELVVDKVAGQKERAASFIKGFASRAHDANIGKMSDAEVRDLIAGRYA